MISDIYVGNEVIYRTLENGNADADFVTTPLLTSMFSKQEILDSMNRVQQAFLLETGVIVTRTTIVGQVGKPKYDLPVDSIRPRRVTWADASEGRITTVNPLLLLEDESDLLLEDGSMIELEQTENISVPIIRVLTQTDTWQLDTGSLNWPSNRDIPIAWWETTLPQQMIGIAQTPINDGVIGLLYVALAATLDGSGIVLVVPDDFTPYILYGTLAELLGSDGPSFDPVREQYCKQRYSEGIELCRLILGG